MTLQLEGSFMQARTGGRYGVPAGERGSVLKGWPEMPVKLCGDIPNAVKSCQCQWTTDGMEAELAYKSALDAREHG